jgi:hypothetical protein
MRVHLAWGLRRPQLGLETAAAARNCRMTILQMCVLARLVIPTDRNLAFCAPACTERCAGDGELVFHGALILWPGSANWLAGDNGKIEKKWGRGVAGSEQGLPFPSRSRTLWPE